MSPPAVKAMILALDAAFYDAYLGNLLAIYEGDLREPLMVFAAHHGLEI
jgi:hypothetical protein